VVRGISTRYFSDWRAEHGLPPIPRGHGILRDGTGRPATFLNAWSEHVAPNPPDWPANVETIGYWFLDSHPDWTPSSDLAAFLDAGPPPVYIGFGSMASRHPERTTRLVLDAVSASGCRAILASGWGGLTPGDLPDGVFRLEDAPHDGLFPRCAAVVHHGGAGTTAAGLRAGRPTVICPFFGDQPFWGRRVHELGAGPEPIPQKTLTAPKLAAAIREATETPSIRDSARDLGRKIRGENGIQRAMHHLNALISAPSGK
jgi:sterol 3beta-glucosyltransferase